jgi:DNA-binding transcriptional LysR family regulator
VGNLTALAGWPIIDKNWRGIDRINMSPHQLELFYHVARFKGVSRAVRQMPYGIQQPSVSTQVNALERDLGVTLYERRPFRLTPAGEELFKFVEPFFGRIGEIRERLQGAARIRIGASPILFRDYLPPVIESLRRQFPRLNLILRALNQPELAAAIEQDELDIIISLIPDNLGPGIRAVDIVELPLVLLALKTAKVKSAEDLWAGEKPAEPLISLGPNELICQQFQGALARLGVSWLPRMEMDSLDLIEQYVAAGYGIGLSVRLPDSRLPAKIRALELPGFPAVRMGVLYRAGNASNDQVRAAFLDLVRTHAAHLAKRG